MRKAIYIFPVVCTVAVLLHSCGAASMKEEASTPYAQAADSTAVAAASDTESGLFADSLSDEQKELFGKSAMQKLEDYYGCLDIMSDAKYDSTLRNQAKAIALEMFYDQKEVLGMFGLAMDDSFGITRTTVRDLNISRLPQQLNDSTYKGQIAFDLQTNDREGSREQIDFTVRKIRKNFGSEQSMIWETYLERKD